MKEGRKEGRSRGSDEGREVEISVRKILISTTSIVVVTNYSLRVIIRCFFFYSYRIHST